MRDARLGVGFGFLQACYFLAFPLTALFEQVEPFKTFENGALGGTGGCGRFEAIVLGHGLYVV
jgi:hypothetical protein